MEKNRFYFLALAFLSVLLYACGQAGVSQQFTKEISEFETAWKNTGNAFSSVKDSVTACANSMYDSTQMKIPDTLAQRVTGEDKAKLDSIAGVCKSQKASCQSLLISLNAVEGEWKKESNAFAVWKDKVFKGAIDIETARKDLEIYKTKLKETNSKSSEASDKLSELKSACESNCAAYSNMLNAVSKRRED